MYRRISLLSVAGKVYGRIVVHRAIERTNFLMSDEQGEYRSGRGCVNQIFASQQLCMKACAKNIKIYMASMDLEKAYDRVEVCIEWSESY